MPIPVTCACGRSMQVKDELAGKQGMCPSCGRLLHIPELDRPLDSTEPRNWSPDAGQEEPPDDRYAPDRGLRPARSRSVRKEAQVPPAGEDPRRAGNTHAAVVSGALLMSIALVWWAIGVFLLEQVFIYPAILFFLGLASLFGWLTSRD